MANHGTQPQYANAQYSQNNQQSQDYLLKCLRLQYHVLYGPYHLRCLDQLVQKQRVLNAKIEFLDNYNQSNVQVANAIVAVTNVIQLQEEIDTLTKEIDAEQVELSLRQEAIKQQNPRKFALAGL